MLKHSTVSQSIFEVVTVNKPISTRIQPTIFFHQKIDLDVHLNSFLLRIMRILISYVLVLVT